MQIEEEKIKAALQAAGIDGGLGGVIGKPFRFLEMPTESMNEQASLATLQGKVIAVACKVEGNLELIVTISPCSGRGDAYITHYEDTGFWQIFAPIKPNCLFGPVPHEVGKLEILVA